ncbi:uncharacterized protein [Leptinotarsa decemlineata]|uniref:uncharacterized protein n=1 Tax=Leptinotarsa decemlineata TaxID=7539 RepID=UPI003D305E7A
MTFLSHGFETLHNFLDHLNDLHPNIKPTNNSLSFLDVLIKKSNNSFTHTVNRKPTHTNRYLNANSHHHPTQTNSVLNSLIHRFINLIDRHNKPQELSQLKSALLQNGFTDHQIDTSIRRQQTSPSSPKDPKDNNVPYKAFLPYIIGVTDKISQIFKKQDIKTIFTANNQIFTFLLSPKDTIVNESQVLSKHQQETGHNVEFANTKTIATAKTLQARIIREAIEIEKRPPVKTSGDGNHPKPRSTISTSVAPADIDTTEQPSIPQFNLRSR